MKILAHRGCHGDGISENSPEALRIALGRGFGFESDVRIYNGELVISHDAATFDSPKATEIFRFLEEFEDKYTFAINVKEDGMRDLLCEQLEPRRIKNYFLFDMSVPQMMDFNDAGLTFFTRQSDVEANPVFYESAAGVWLDGFFGYEWITEGLLRYHISRGKKVCIVSPELHNGERTEFWREVAAFDVDFSNVMLCTDYPEEAARFFAKYTERGKTI